MVAPWAPDLIHNAKTAETIMDNLAHMAMLSVRRVPELLIEQATSHQNLCQCFVGWCPFW